MKINGLFDSFGERVYPLQIRYGFSHTEAYNGNGNIIRKVCETPKDIREMFNVVDEVVNVLESKKGFPPSPVCVAIPGVYLPDYDFKQTKRDMENALKVLKAKRFSVISSPHAAAISAGFPTDDYVLQLSIVWDQVLLNDPRSGFTEPISFADMSFVLGGDSYLHKSGYAQNQKDMYSFIEEFLEKTSIDHPEFISGKLEHIVISGNHPELRSLESHLKQYLKEYKEKEEKEEKEPNEIVVPVKPEVAVINGLRKQSEQLICLGSEEFKKSLTSVVFG